MKQPRVVVQSFVVLMFVTGGRLLALNSDECRGTDALTIRLVHPDRQVAGILRLFEGSPSPHPAAALASWKRASREPDRLGKPTEAVIALFNPQIVAEWRAFHEMRFQLGMDGRLHWRLAVPQDDGTLAALITALRLSDDSPQGSVRAGRPEIERLGRGGAVATRSGPGMVLSGSQADLEQALDRPVRTNALPLTGSDLDSGVIFHLEPQRLTAIPGASALLRRLIEVPRALGCDRVDGQMSLRRDRLELDIASELGHEASAGSGGDAPAVIDPAWLSWIPARQAGAVICLATGGRPPEWDRLFSAADRIDRADPARANLAPLRARVNLFAIATGIQLEADLWPHLRGITLAVLAEPNAPGKLGSALLCLHLDKEDSASRVVDHLLPRLAARGGRNVGDKNAAAKGHDRTPVTKSAKTLGNVAGRPLEAVARGSTVVVGWGEGALSAALRSPEYPAESARSLLPLDEDAKKPPPDRFGLFWPGRLAIPVNGLDGVSPLARSLAEGPPICWSGRTSGNRAHDRVRWGELNTAIRRFLRSIPLGPATKLGAQ